MFSDSYQMDRCICTSSNCCIGYNGIFKRFSGEDVRWFDIFSDHIYDPKSGGLRTSIKQQLQRLKMVEVRYKDSLLTYAHCPRSRYGAGIALLPGRAIPSASARAFIVEAVPRVLQCPTYIQKHYQLIVCLHEV